MVLISAFLAEFSFLLSRTLRTETEQQMADSTAQITYFINSRLEDIFSTMHALALYVGEHENITSPQMLQKLHEQGNRQGFYSLVVVFPGEAAYMDDGRVTPSVEYEYYKKVLAGGETVSAVNNSKLDGVDIVSFSVPIYQKGEVVAALTGVFTTDMLKELVDTPIVGEGKAYIIQSDGTLVTDTADLAGQNYFDVLRSVSFQRGSAEEVLQGINNGASGTVQYTYKEASRYVRYAPLGVNDWYTLTVVHASSIARQSAEISKNAIFLAVKIFCLMLGLMLAVLYSQRKGQKIISDINQKFETVTSNIPGGVFRYLLSSGTFDYISDGLLELFGCDEKRFRDRFDNRFINMVYALDRERVARSIAANAVGQGKDALEYRIQREDGSICWLFDRGQTTIGSDGQRWVYVVAVDITDLKNANEEMRLSERRYRIVIEQSQSVIFEYNIQTGSIFYTGNYKKRFGFAPVTTGFPECMLKLNIIHPDDQSGFMQLITAMSNGEMSHAEEEIRLLRDNGAYLWCGIQATPICDNAGSPIRIVGRISDIDAQKRETEHLKEQTQRDPLTKLYNKEATATLLREHLQGAGKQHQNAVLFIDIDNFKAINDSQGHMVGDAVLAELAQGMLSLFRTTDVVGRIGGDEFVVFIKDIRTRDLIVEKARDLCMTFHRVNREMEIDVVISGSVGIAVYPGDGSSYEELLSKADKALYFAKAQGKDRFAFYDDIGE